jgi:hypothetical protein
MASCDDSCKKAFAILTLLIALGSLIGLGATTDWTQVTTSTTTQAAIAMAVIVAVFAVAAACYGIYVAFQECK